MNTHTNIYKPEHVDSKGVHIVKACVQKHRFNVYIYMYDVKDVY